MNASDRKQRHIGIFGATGIGVGAIVGGGILALVGAAFAATGPSAIVAFAFNGVIAVLTAWSFAEVASKFPESGGTYTFAKKVLSVDAAFTVGWVVWFASIVAAVLYAIGFSEFAIAGTYNLWSVVDGPPPDWLLRDSTAVILAMIAIGLYTAALIWRSQGGGEWANIGKLVVFGILILAGVWTMFGSSVADMNQQLRPFFARGATGLFQAMGFTFIALQGFDLIAAVGGEIRKPERNIPRAMFLSLGCALAIYLPLLLVMSTVGVPAGQSITDMSIAEPETVVAVAVEHYLGRFGYWLVIIAAVLSMASALRANLYAASRVAMSMARDRTLPRVFSKISQRETPIWAVVLTGVVSAAILVFLSDVAAAGAAASLIFLVTFALAHWIAILVRQRSGNRPPPFRSPLYPIVPIVGGIACLTLAIYQGIAVPKAGLIAISWIAIGTVLFLGSFARRARIADETSRALDPELLQMRGHSPLVLLPIANPENARALVDVAAALAPPDVGRVLLLSVVVADRQWHPSDDLQRLRNTQTVLCEAIAGAVESGKMPEALTTIAAQPWSEIARVAHVHQCESLLLGLSKLDDETKSTPLDQVMSKVNCDIVVLRAPKGWQLSQVQRILVPTTGGGRHDKLLARLLASFSRESQRELTFLKVVAESAGDERLAAEQRTLRRMAADLWTGAAHIQVDRDNDAVTAIARQAAQHELVILGGQRVSRREKLFGEFALRIARATDAPMLLLSRRG